MQCRCSSRVVGVLNTVLSKLTGGGTGSFGRSIQMGWSNRLSLLRLAHQGYSNPLTHCWLTTYDFMKRKTACFCPRKGQPEQHQWQRSEKTNLPATFCNLVSSKTACSFIFRTQVAARILELRRRLCFVCYSRSSGKDLRAIAVTTSTTRTGLTRYCRIAVANGRGKFSKNRGSCTSIATPLNSETPKPVILIMLSIITHQT